MKIELAQHGDTQWWKEGGTATWGLGIQLDRFGSVSYPGDDEVVMTPEGWSLSLMLGGWSLNFYSKAGHEAIFGTEYGAPWFEVLRS